MHTIHQMKVELHSINRNDALQVQRNLSYHLHTREFMEQLGKAFDGLIGPGDHIEIPELTVRFSADSKEKLAAQLIEVLITAIRERIKVRSTGNGHKDHEAFIAEVRSFFLCNGISLAGNSNGILKELIRDLKELPRKPFPSLEALLFKAARDNPSVWKRLFFLLGAEGMHQLFCRLSGLAEHKVEQLLQSASRTVGGNTAIDAPVIWPQVFGSLADDTFINTGSADGLKNVSVPRGDSSYLKTRHRAEQKDIQRLAMETKVLQDKIAGGLFVFNAGCVLLWSIFGQLLRQLEYVREKTFISDEARQRAILLFHYMITGGTDFSEDELLLNKLLFDWPLYEPVNPELKPDNSLCEKAEDVLKEYIADWRKDRKFSVNWFRAAFLQREGELTSRMDGHWQLKIVPRTEDILIDRISVIRYSWMHHLLFVKW